MVSICNHGAAVLGLTSPHTAQPTSQSVWPSQIVHALTLVVISAIQMMHISPQLLPSNVRSQTPRDPGGPWKTRTRSLYHSAEFEDRGSSQYSTGTLESRLQNGVGVIFLRYGARFPFPPLETDQPPQYLEKALRQDRSAAIPDILNQTFHDVDSSLSKLAEESQGKMHAGCTAVTAFLRVEDESGGQSFLPRNFEPADASIPHGSSGSSHSRSNSSSNEDSKSKGTTSKLMHAIKSIGGASSRSPSPPNHTDLSPSHPSDPPAVFTPPATVRRVLYCANVGDARGVLCRASKAVRLTYDHKGSDKQEAKRIMDAGGFVMSGRVNGVLAVTRSLGDSSMKEFVVGSPYTTETELSEQDEFLILACDGVGIFPSYDSYVTD